MKRLALALVWLALAALPLGLGLFGFGLLVARGVGVGLGMQLALVLARELLLPVLLVGWALWLAAAWLWPAVERGFGALALGLALAASLGFGVALARGISVWEPRGPGDVVSTWALVAGGVALALFLPRRLAKPLGLGSIAGTARRSNVGPP